MKYSLPELKKMVIEHKKSIPKISSGKKALFTYALKHKLVDADTHLKNEEMHEALSKKEREMAKKDIENALSMNEKVKEAEMKKKPAKVKKVEVFEVEKPKPIKAIGGPMPKSKVVKVEKMVEEKKPESKMVHNLREVQRIRKEKNVSLKEAWGIYSKSQKN